MRAIGIGLCGLLTATCVAAVAEAADIKVLTAGAYKQVVVALAGEFEKSSGHKLVIENATVGTLTKRIAGGEAFDVAVVTPAAIENLTKAGKIADGTRTLLARVGVGVMVKAGAPVPDVATVDAFKQMLLAAKTVSYIDPASGGSSGIYVAKLLARLGIAEQIKPKERLKKGGYVADLIKDGTAEIGIHQISEIVPVKEVTLVGPLPAEIQNYTTYAAGISGASKSAAAARALIAHLSGPKAAEILKAKGMQPPGS